jgi:NADPH-dependent 2,4-dienoyl-CoA reductase/sulfur reductase-like enzyme
MTELEYDVLVIGGGASGMAAAMEVHRRGFRPVIVEREARLGGILLQCIHNGFGVQEFKKEFTGPEYAEEFIDQVHEAGIDVFLSTTVIELSDNGDTKEASCFSALNGVV